MDPPGAKLLSLVLARSGCLPYANRMLEQLENFEHKIYVSAYATERTPKDSYKVKTFRNMPEFFLHSLWFLPVLLIRLWKDFQRGYHTVYFPVFHHWNLPVLLVMKGLGIRSIYTVHNGKLHAGEDSRINQYVQDQCIRLADEVVFLTNFVREETRHRLSYAGIDHVIPHGLLQLPGLHFQQRSLPARPKLLFLGRIERYKGLELLLAALAEIPAERTGGLTIAGKSAYPLSLPALPHPVRLIDKRLSDTEIVTLLHRHDLMILPYREATQSGILTLAISAGLPCICTEVGGLPEQLSAEEAVFVPPTADGIRDGILQLMDHPEKYRRIHQKLKQRALDTGWEAAGAQLRRLIKGES